MSRWLAWTATWAMVVAATAASQGGELDARLLELMANAPPGEPISCLLYLRANVDLHAAQTMLANRRADARERHEFIITMLQDTARGAQERVKARAGALQADGRAQLVRPYWIWNIIRVDASPDVIKELAAHDDVERVYFNAPVTFLEPVTLERDVPQRSSGPTASLEAIRAPDAWAMGYDGTGVLVAAIDSGVAGNHPALTSRWAGRLPQYSGHPEWAWFDPAAGLNLFPHDFIGHGTHTMGTICGGSPGDTIGVAPGAHWIATCPLIGTIGDILEAFEWMVDPDGNPATNWDVPVVCSNSWGGEPPWWTRCDPIFWQFIDAVEAAGIVVLFAAGNSPSAVYIPADRATTPYNTCAIGATDAETAEYPWPIAAFSSRGPTYCTPSGAPAIKPELVAPGVAVYSSWPGNSYALMSGTSMAAPHVAGVVALMRQANPELTVNQVKQVLYDTALDLGPPGEDNTFGWGQVDAVAAIQRALDLILSPRGRVDLDKLAYSCADSIEVRVRDTDLDANPNLIETVTVEIFSSSSPDPETVVCTETGPNTARFVGSIATGSVAGPGVLVVAHDDVITAVYQDADNGQGQPGIAQATAQADCVPATVSNVVVSPITGHTARITFETSKKAIGRVRWGLSCDALTELKSPDTMSYRTAHVLTLTGIADGTTFHFRVETEDKTGNVGLDPECRSFTTVDLRDHFTEHFTGPHDLAYTMLVFEPAPGPDGYSLCVEAITALPTDPAGGVPLDVNFGLLDRPKYATLHLPYAISFYGQLYTTLYVNQHGYISFVPNDDYTGYHSRLQHHFASPHIAAFFFAMLMPVELEMISYRTLPDRVAITWNNVPLPGWFDPNARLTAQVELYYDGRITISHAQNTIVLPTGHEAITGLSSGGGVPSEFLSANLSNRPTCGVRPPIARVCHYETAVNTPALLTLLADDDGTPAPLSYTVTSLPQHGHLLDPSAGSITVVPYTLPNHEPQVVYVPHADYFGTDAFGFKANDGGVPPTGGDSNIGQVNVLTQHAPPAFATEEVALPAADVGLPYAAAIPLSGGQPPVTFELLPPLDYYEFDLGTSLFAEVGTLTNCPGGTVNCFYVLPFMFPFYGDLFQALWICPYGTISPAGTFCNYDNDDFALADLTLIAPLWKDQQFAWTPGGGLYLLQGSDFVTLRWKSAGNDAPPYPPMNYCATLFADGRIRFDYGPGNERGDYPTIGISFGYSTQRFTKSRYDGRRDLNSVNSVEFRPLEPLAGPFVLHPGGVLSGTPLTAASRGQRVRAIDALGRTAEAIATLKVGVFHPADLDRNGQVNSIDAQLMCACLAGPQADLAPPGCDPVVFGRADLDDDGDVDLFDLSAFQQVFQP